MTNLSPRAALASLFCAASIVACSGDGGGTSPSPSLPPADDGPGTDAVVSVPGEGDALPPGMTPVPGTEIEFSGSTTMLDDLALTPLGDTDAAGDAEGGGGSLIPNLFASRTGIDEAFAQSGGTLVEFFDDSLVLPRDVAVNFIDCETENAFYAPDAAEIGFPGPNIFICHELTAEFLDFYNGDARSAFLASAFVLVHELGHALVDQLDLPVLGIEESYVDGIAAVFTGEGGMAEATLLAGLFFLAQGDSPWFDTHRVGMQRFGDLACWAIGADPRLTDDPATRDIADQLVQSGRDCVAAYRQQLEGLTRVLDTHVRGGLGDAFSSAADLDIKALDDASGGAIGNVDGAPPALDLDLALWDASTADGNVMYVVIVREGDAAGPYVLNFLGDAVDAGEDCYTLVRQPIALERFAEDADGRLLLDGGLVGLPLELENLPDFPACPASSG